MTHATGTRLACLLAAALMGCSADITTPVEPPSGMRWGTLEHYGDGPTVTVPGEVSVGSTVTIIAKTWGGGCLAKGRTEVGVEGRRVLIRVFDVQESGACTLPLLTVDHTANILFDTPGTWQIDIQGMALPGERLVTVRRQVTVE